MVVSEIAVHRLCAHLISRERYEAPNQVVSWLGAMQAQYYSSVKWAIGLRCKNSTNAMIEQAIANGTIVRTWLMRGTLQVVALSDLSWMLEHLAPRAIATSSRRYRQLELDDRVFSRSYDILAEVLAGGRSLTRGEILLELEQAGVSTVGQRGYHILRRAGLEGLICLGPNRDQEETFVLLDKVAPPIRAMEREEALAALARGYFSSHGPATVRDFAWWSGLTMTDARIGLEIVKRELRQEKIEGQNYWLPRSDSVLEDVSPMVYLLPAYDEYYLGYKERSAVLDAKYDKRAISHYGVFKPMVVIDGQIMGTWKGTYEGGTIVIKSSLFRPLREAESQSLLVAANHYSAFLGLSAKLIDGAD